MTLSCFKTILYRHHIESVYQKTNLSSIFKLDMGKQVKAWDVLACEINQKF